MEHKCCDKARRFLKYHEERNCWHMLFVRAWARYGSFEAEVEFCPWCGERLAVKPSLDKLGMGEGIYNLNGESVYQVCRPANENLVECECGKLYSYFIFEGYLGIFLEPAKARIVCPFCGSVKYKSIRAHSGDTFNASLTVEG